MAGCCLGPLRESSSPRQAWTLSSLVGKKMAYSDVATAWGQHCSFLLVKMGSEDDGCVQWLEAQALWYRLRWAPDHRLCHSSPRNHLKYRKRLACL